MPYEWHDIVKEAPEHSGASFLFASGVPPRAHLSLWPYRSLSKRGFVIFISATALMLLVPLIGLIGRTQFWGILPFLLGAVGLVWLFLNRSYRDGEILEQLQLWPDRIELTRQAPRTDEQRWIANPYWVEVKIYPHHKSVPAYLTLTGEGREVEVGAFLTEEERTQLYGELKQWLDYMNAPGIAGAQDPRISPDDP